MREFCFKYRGFLFVPAALLMLVLAEPTPASMAIGFSIAFFIGESIRIWAVGFTGVTTREDKVKAPQLVTAGPYAYIRNPLYLGNLLSWIGFSIAAVGDSPVWAKIVVFISVLGSYAFVYGNVIPYEENFLRDKFGENFREYEKNVPRLIPRLKPYEKQNGSYDPEVILKAEIHTIVMLVIVSVLVVVRYFYPQQIW